MQKGSSNDSPAGRNLLATASPIEHWLPGPWPVPQALAGIATISPAGPVEAGSWQSFEIVYVAGKFGIDDSGSIKVCFKFASDQGMLQLDDPAGPGYVTVEASNGAALQVRFDPKQNVRPWDKTLHVKVSRGFMREGDRLTIRLGDRRYGSAGLRMQTFAEPCFKFHIVVDPIACYHFVPLENQPAISIVGGERSKWAAVLPSSLRAGEPFSLRLRSEDVWGNLSGKKAVSLGLSGSPLLNGLPSTVSLDEEEAVVTVEGLSVSSGTVFQVEVRSADGTLVCRSNPACVREDTADPLFWADFHAQSGETIGTNSAEEYFTYARDAAFLDIVGHQGNDFQITPELWGRLNRLFDAYDVPGRFVVIPGYEWSGNTALGGDRNVFYKQSGRRIRRSSHALVPDQSDIDSDCHTARDLFEALHADGEEVITFAHVGGRYADIGFAHDASIETAVEVHSSWGTFEWIVNDAFDLGYRVGIVANSDGHKGRPGAESPGASMFGAPGGLTCLQMPELSRTATFAALRARRHYATTGSRMILDVAATFDRDAITFGQDPALGPTLASPACSVPMGAIVHTEASLARIRVTLHAPAPIERIEIRNGRQMVHVSRPYGTDKLGRRIRVVWSGAEYRGRFRMTNWDGEASLENNAIERCEAINFFNSDRPLEMHDEHRLSWRSVTTGNLSGFDALLRSPEIGTLHIRTPFGAIDRAIDAIRLEPAVFDFGGLDRKVEIYRLPDVNPHLSVSFEHEVALDPTRDNPLYVSALTEDGHRAWSSPIYVVPRPHWLPRPKR